MNKFKKLFRNRVDMADYMVLTGIFLGALYWALESLLNVFSPEEISFYQEIFGPNISVVWPRLIVFCLFLMFGSHVQFTINERKKASEALKESEEKYRTILESIEEGYYEVDFEGYFVFVNDSLSKILKPLTASLIWMAPYCISKRRLPCCGIQEACQPDIEEYCATGPKRRKWSWIYWNLTVKYRKREPQQSWVLPSLPNTETKGPAPTWKESGSMPESLRCKWQGTPNLAAVSISNTLTTFTSLQFYTILEKSVRRMRYCLSPESSQKWDGSGYPQGLKGEAIPLSARIIALADVYDALTTKRFYKEAYSHDRAKNMIMRLKGKQFDPEIVNAFTAVVEKFNHVRKEKLKEQADFSQRPARAVGR
jgi:hypothetical protein